MPGLLPAHLLVHVATPVSYTEDLDPSSDVDADVWIEGEPGDEGVSPISGVPFACVLFLPGPGGEVDTAYRPRVVKTPTLLYNPTRDDDSIVTVGREDELLIEAPELAPWTGAAVARWLLQGDAQPFGPPGQVGGLMATVRQVRD